jgi:UDP-4-amino-4,6-dideoxy-N-acetyl-beta-L-altrosamine N-acetyltransferase
VTNPFLIGDKVYLRAIEMDDRANIIRWLNHPDVQRTTLRARPLNLDDETDFIQRMRQSPNDIVFLIVARDDDRAVGGTAFHQIDWRSRHTCFGITIGESADWGKGYGTEATRLMVDYAFATLNLNRVWLHVLEYNERGVRCYERVGFKKEGLLRQEHFRDGRYWDTHLMAILRDDWLARRGVQ